MTDDRARFEALFVTHYGALVRYAVRRVGPDSAQEVVAETFLVAWRRISDVPDNALPWLYATARKILANELRRRRRALRLGELLESTSQTTVADHADLVTDQLRVRAALAALRLQDQEALQLIEWDGLSIADAAAVLNCTESALKVRLHRARRRLAALIEPASAQEFTVVAEGEAR